MSKWKSTICLVLIFMLVMGAVTGCSSSSSSEEGETEEVVIGNILPLSGAAAPVGLIGKQARDMAVEEINEAGGIKALGGAKIRMIYADSEGDPAVGVTEAERLITSEKVTLISGTYQSGVALPATEVTERYGVPFYCPVPSEDIITERDFKYVFRQAEKTSWRNRDQIAFIKDMEEKMGTPVKTLAFVYEDTAWGQGAVRGWEKYLEDTDYEVVLKEPYPSDSSDLTPVVLKLKQIDPDVILLVSYVSDAILLTNNFAEHEVRPLAFIGTSGGYADPAYFDGVGDNAEYFFDIATWEPDVNRPFSKETNEKFTEKFGFGMNAEAVKAYTSMYIIADALERAGSTEPEAITEALAATSITDGVTQMYAHEIVFDEDGQMVNAPLIISQFHKVDGKMERVTVWPEEDARLDWEPVWPFPGWDK